jgi:prolyl oligopeptidase
MSKRTDMETKETPSVPHPKTRWTDHTDVLHGTTVADPYRWLEDSNSDEVRRWIGAQNRFTSAHLEQIPARARILKRMRELYDYDRFGLPRKRGGRYFFTRQTGLQNQPVLCWSASAGSEPTVLLDPNELSDDGTVALTSWEPSKDGCLLAYGLASSGSDWQEWRVRDVETGCDLDDHLTWVRYTVPAWTHDAAGFFYSRYDKPAEGLELKATTDGQKFCYHRIGADQAQDAIIYERRDHPDWGFQGEVTADGQYLVISVWTGSLWETGLLVKDLTRPSSGVEELLLGFDARYTFVGSDGPLFYLLTDLDAPNYRVVALDVRHSNRSSWREIIPQGRDALQIARLVGGKLLGVYLHDVHSLLIVHDRSGQRVAEVSLPRMGTVAEIEGHPEDSEVYYSYTDFSTPATIYRYETTTGTSTTFVQPSLPFDPSKYVTEQVVYTSKDGTPVRMFITQSRDLQGRGPAPTYLYGYGGFDVALTPFFTVRPLSWLELGGRFAVANIRGGGEHGKAWHEAGTKANKQNVFDDFISAAEYLIDNHYTTRDKLAIGGWSNGGLLVGACMTQHPELFGACLPGTGVLDMLRFHKFTIGWAWTRDYGSPDDPEQFKSLLAYSPYHNVRAGTHYPPTLITTSDHDDRVFPAHSYKFAAALQAAQAGDAPILLRVETKAGHGLGKPVSKAIEEYADRWAFLVHHLHMDV